MFTNKSDLNFTNHVITNNSMITSTCQVPRRNFRFLHFGQDVIISVIFPNTEPWKFISRLPWIWRLKTVLFILFYFFLTLKLFHAIKNQAGIYLNLYIVSQPFTHKKINQLQCKKSIYDKWFNQYIINKWLNRKHIGNTFKYVLGESYFRKLWCDTYKSQ